MLLNDAGVKIHFSFNSKGCDMHKEIDVRKEQINQHLKNKLLQKLTTPKRLATAIDGLMLSRQHEEQKNENCFYRPTIGLVVQGFKRSIIGSEEYQYGAQHCLIAGVDTPSVNQIIGATPQKPFLAVSIKLDRYLITQLIAELPKPESLDTKNATPRGIILTVASQELLDAFLRLIDLLDHPERITVLAPMIIREIHYLLLTGPYGDKLQALSSTGTQANRIAQAIHWLRENYAATLNIEALAQQVHMAPSSFHRHFRQVTTLSPLQFQKRLRLYEAERLMLTEGKDALSAALAVGYESATQFNREYKRQFGEPPFRDVSKKRLVGVLHSNKTKAV